MPAKRKSNDHSFGRWRMGVLSTLFIGSVLLNMPLHGQESQLTTTIGVVNSLTRNTMIVKAEDGLFRLYTFDGYTTKPATIPIGSQVRVMSYPSGDSGFRIAYVVTVLRAGP